MSIRVKLCAFADESASDTVGQVKNLLKNGIYAVEMRSADGQNVGDFTEEKAKEVYKHFNGSGIEVWAIGSPLGKIDFYEPFEKHYELLKRLVQTAHIMNCENIRMFSYFMQPQDYLKRRDEVLERLSVMCDYAEKNGVRLCHENESGIFGATAENCAFLLDGERRLKGVFDPANFIMCDEDVLSALKLLYNKTYYFHVKDVVESSKCIVPSGYGKGRIAETLQMLDRDATFTIEPHLRIFDGYDKIDAKQLKNVVTYPDSETAFAAAVSAFKTTLEQNGYCDGGKGIWIK